MTAFTEYRKGLRSGSGSDDDPPGIDQARAVAVKEFGKLYFGVGHRALLAAKRGRSL